MRLLALTSLVMVAFAANSILNRAALADEQISPLLFAWVRALSGAVALALMVVVRDRALSLAGPYRLAGVLSLSLYMLAFSVAYVDLDAGVGALILFGGVQITMICGALAAREIIPGRRWFGAALAFIGLVWLLWPAGPVQISPIHGALMCCAAIGWGIYSLVGRKSGEPLRATAANFILAAPICICVPLFLPASPEGATDTTALGLSPAILSGTVTSAMGYALWYSVLPRLTASVAGVGQLTVPVIAVLGGIVILGEAVTISFVIASVLVLGGVAVSVLDFRRKT